MKDSRIAEERKKLGLTQEELATQLKVSQKSISKYERGNRRPSYETLVLMSSIFGVSVDYLLGNDGLSKSVTELDSTKQDSFFFFIDELLKDVFVSRIKRALSEKGLSEKDFFERVSLETEKGIAYLNGEYEPSLEDLIKIAQALTVSTDYLLGLDETKPITNIDKYFSQSLTERERNIIDVYRQLNKDNRDIIVGKMKEYLKEQRYEESVVTKSSMQEVK